MSVLSQPDFHLLQPWHWNKPVKYISNMQPSGKTWYLSLKFFFLIECTWCCSWPIYVHATHRQAGSNYQLSSKAVYKTKCSLGSVNEWYIYICMFVYMYICICVCKYKCKYIYIYSHSTYPNLCFVNLSDFIEMSSVQWFDLSKWGEGFPNYVKSRSFPVYS